MLREQLEQELNAYYAGTGYNKCDTLDWLLDKGGFKGYDSSYDGSLVVIYYEGFTLIAGSAGDHTFLESKH